MATLRDQIQVLRKKNRTPQQIRDAMGKAFNTTPDKLAPFLENDVRDIPGILAGQNTAIEEPTQPDSTGPKTMGQIMEEQGISTDIGKSGLGAATTTKMPEKVSGPGLLQKTSNQVARKEFAAAEQKTRDATRRADITAAAKEISPTGDITTPTRGTIEEQEEVSGSTDAARDLRARQMMEEAQKPETVRVGGILNDPIGTAEYMGGVLSGLFDMGNSDAYDKAAKHTAETRKKRKKGGYNAMGFVYNFEDDMATVAGGLAGLVGTAVVGTPVLREDAQTTSMADRGKEMGKDIIPGMAGSTAEALSHPLDTMYTAPLSSALTIIPAARAAIAMGKMSPVVAAALKRVEVGTAKALGTAPGPWNKFISGMETGNPHANVILDELVEKARKVDETFGKGGPKVPRDPDTPFHTGDTAIPKPATVGPSAEFTKSRLGLRETARSGSGVESDFVRELSDEARQVGAQIATNLKDELERMSGGLRAKGVTPGEMQHVYEGALTGALADQNISFLLHKSNKNLLSEVAERLGYTDADSLRRVLISEGSVALTKEGLETLPTHIQDVLTAGRQSDVGREFMGKRAEIHLRQRLKGAVQGDVLDTESMKFLGGAEGISIAAKPTRGAIGVEAAAQSLVEAIPDGSRMPQFIRASRPGQTRTALVAALRKKGRNDIADHISGLKSINETGPLGATGLVDDFLYGYLSPQATAAKHGLVTEMLSSQLKAVALPLNSKAVVNNIIGNEVLTSLALGQVPGTNLIKAIARGAKAWAGKLNPMETTFVSAAKRMGLYNTNVVAADIGITEGIATGKLTQALQKFREAYTKPGGVLMGAGDEMYKIPVAFGEFKFGNKALAKLTTGTEISVRVGERVKVDIIKRANGNFDLKYTSRGVDATSARSGQLTNLPANSPKIADILARYGKVAADGYYFDYGNVPRWLAKARKQPVIGAGSAFFTWAWKSLDLPGKPGLLTAAIRGPRTLTSTSPAVNFMLAKSHAAMTMRRAGLIGAIHQEGQYDPEIARMMAWNPSDPSILITKDYGNPFQRAVARASSAGFLSSTLMLMNITAQGIDYAWDKATNKQSTIDKLMKSENGSDKFMAASLQLREDATRKKDPVASALKLVGLSGTIAMDAYIAATEADQMGKSFSVLDFAKNSYLPAPARTFILRDGFDERFRKLEPGEKGIETKADFFIRNAIGLGYQAINTKDQYQRFRSGIQREMNANFDAWKSSRKLKLAKIMGKDEQAADLEEQITKSKNSIKQSLLEMDEYWANKHNIDTIKRKRMK